MATFRLIPDSELNHDVLLIGFQDLDYRRAPKEKIRKLIADPSGDFYYVDLDNPAFKAGQFRDFTNAVNRSSEKYAQLEEILSRGYETHPDRKTIGECIQLLEKETSADVLLRKLSINPPDVEKQLFNRLGTLVFIFTNSSEKVRLFLLSLLPTGVIKLLLTGNSILRNYDEKFLLMIQQCSSLGDKDRRYRIGTIYRNTFLAKTSEGENSLLQ